MSDRRTVLKSCIALPVASVAAAVGAPLRIGYAQSGALALERFVYDVRFAESYNIAQHAAGLGVSLSPIADNLMELWYDELDLLWRQEPRALAGVTMTEALFVLETLALDRRMRVVYRGDHSLVEDGQIRHNLVGPAQVVERFASPRQDARWEADLATAMTECPLGKIASTEVKFVTRTPGLSIRDVPLASWIIAPRSVVERTATR